MNLGLFLPNWVGDVVMATPTLRALRGHLGSQARMVGILRPYVADVLAGTPWLDGHLEYDPRGRQPAQRGLGFLRRLRAERFDAVVLLTNSLRTGLWAWLSGAPRRIGYARGGRGPLLTDRLHAERLGWGYRPAPVLDYYLRLAYALGCPAESPRLELATTEADERAADRAFRALRLPPGEPVIVLNSGGAYGAAKLWPTEYFALLARQLAERLGQRVVVVCGPSERDVARQIAAGANHPGVVSLADEPLSIGLTKAIVRRARLMVTTDSGPRHFAAAFDVPVVTLFGPTHIAWSENHYPRAVHLQKQLPCGPCQRRVCPLGHHRCMRDLTVDEVYRAVEQQLSAPRPAVAA